MHKRDSAQVPKKAPLSLSKYGAAFDYMLEGCQIISRDYRYLYVNDVVVKQGRAAREKLLGRTMMECYPGIEKSEMFAHLTKCIEDGVPHSMENEFRFPDGAVGWFELRIEPLPEGAIILSIDITERKRAEEQEQHLEELKNTFVMIVSHQLRTPLSVVRGSLENLRDPRLAEHKDMQRNMLKIAYDAAVEIAERLDEVLMALNVQEGRQSIKKEPVDFEKLWLGMYGEFRRRCKEKRITLVYNPPEEPLPPLLGDGEKLTLVLAGLTDNALQYTPLTGDIAVDIFKKGRRVHFRISDTGVGIPAKEQPMVFNRFFRGSNALKISPDATGLSLAVAKYYVEKHGGTIGFKSVQNEGSTFWVELPIRKAAS